MLSPVPPGGRALAAQAPKLASTGAGDDGIRLLRNAVLEYSNALEHEAARFPCNVPDHSLEGNECGRTLPPVHHQVFDPPLAGNIAGERLCDGGSSHLWQVLTLTKRLLVPAPDFESGFLNVLHVSPPPLPPSRPKAATASLAVAFGGGGKPDTTDWRTRRCATLQRNQFGGREAGRRKLQMRLELSERRTRFHDTQHRSVRHLDSIECVGT